MLQSFNLWNNTQLVPFYTCQPAYEPADRDIDFSGMSCALPPYCLTFRTLCDSA